MNSYGSTNELPHNVLIIDNDNLSSELLNQILKKKQIVLSSEIVNSFDAARKVINSGQINTIFIDPLNFNLDKASDFIFTIREAHSEIVFVLYLNQSNAEKNSSEFYNGERNRFLHYYKLDKQTPIESFEEEVNAAFNLIQSDLVWRTSQENILALKKEANILVKRKSDAFPSEAMDKFKELVEALSLGNQPNPVNKKSVFFSHRFAEEEYIDGLSAYLTDNGFTVVTGASANTYISKAIIQRIKECEFFLCLMTKYKEKTDKTFVTSSWLIEEKGVALAYQKPIVLMIEEGVTDFGGLQGDWQRIDFTAKGFLTAALKAVKQLKSYTGED